MNPIVSLNTAWKCRCDGIDADAIITEVARNGRLTPGYLFLTFASAAVATLGLLLDSAAVVIGSMLLAPLLGPILQIGFALARRDGSAALRALGTSVVGTATALAMAALIVVMAPSTPATAEILARTQPGVADLLIALFAGLAGAYAVIRRLDGTFAGFAIATALMPPLGTVAYGLARDLPAMAQGAAVLFLINFTTIAVSTAAVAVWHGLHRAGSPQLAEKSAMSDGHNASQSLGREHPGRRQNSPQSA